MNKTGLYLGMLVSVITLSTLVPAYAEVTSLKTSASFYKGGNMIQFSGTTLSTDSPNVTILIFDPNNKFVLLASGITDNNHAFQVSVDTSIPSNKQLLSIKGMYNATAFVANKTNGKTVSFAFSPDGSPITPSPPTNLSAISTSSTEVDLNWIAPQNNGGLPITGYKIERNDGNGFNIIAKSQTTTYQDKGLIPNSEHSYRVSAVNSAGSSDPSNSAPVITPPSPTTLSVPNTGSPTNQNSNQSLSDILQQRYAAARKLQEMINAQTSGPSNASSSPPSNTQQNIPQNIQLIENTEISDMASTMESKKSSNMPENNLEQNSFTNFDIKSILYPAISVVGVVIVITILYFRKKRKLGTVIRETQDAHLPVEQTFEKQDDDYAMAILKNRLAKGEITVDEFKILKDELSEP